ncbi:transpeptidase family protein [Parapedobacter sp. ISTM3]|uniref:Cell division protein FtsI (Penicillin-binding protein 3) n=1 Tax=Parapedobacter luteus TaxID=623280 RepID=A0A1T5E122_9SPHI|nr:MULTISPECIES: penicillin-binding protein [Parapedobacter]MBK1440999.1 transpeptidase family protein [Parapedobacter sp. ISTM3]SKB77584.1 cell division protein FtsI (penicillin-binding protein 3) [Parapedobacter luteus]
MNIRTDILLRVYLSFGLIVLIAIAVLAKLFHLQYVEGAEWREMADSLSTRYVDVEAVRGNIFSNDGSLLATSIPEYDLRMDLLAPGIESDEVFYSKVDSLAAKLSAFFNDKSSAQYSRLLKEARKRKNRYYLLKRNVGHQALKQIMEFPIFNLGKYKGGLIAERKNKRILPFTNLAARTIGYKIPAENVHVGLEGAYGEYIDGKSGKRLVQRIAGGVWMPVNREIEVAPVDGADIISTIDVNMQDMAQRALEKQLIASNADNGCVILMEVATGEIRAVANFTKDADGVYREKFNYAIAQSAEPGSTFKLASYLVALEDGKIDTNTVIETGNGTYQVHRHTIRDTHAYGTVTVKKAFEVSSNVAITKIINTHYRENPAAFTKRLHALHLNEPLGLQIPGEGNPLIKTPSSKSWSGLSLPQMAYGYELKMTPLQMLTLYNAVANNGKMVAPLFVKEIRHLGNTVERFETRVIEERIASEQTIGKLRAMLEGVMVEGTGKRLRNPQFATAGKTGTAQMADGAAGYANRRYQSSFAGYFPADNPKYSMIVVIRNPRNGYYGASIAGPVFRELADMVYANDLNLHQDFERMRFVGNTEPPPSLKGSKAATLRVFNALGVKTTYASAEPMQHIDTVKGISFSDEEIKEGIVPDVTGMGLIDALYALENSGYRTKVKGKGKVIAQSLPAGQKVKMGASVLIELK